MIELFQRPTGERVEAILEALPASSRERLASISPSRARERLRTPLYLMHDRSDRFIPFTESRRLVAEAPAGTVRQYTEFELFAHVTPDRQLAPLVFLRELAKLYYHAWLVSQAFL